MRNKEVINKVALLATGDEVCQGDILNTNSQEIAFQLTREGMQVRMHMSAPDTIAEIENAVHFLLESHQALIITGGLGPTSDDLTRFALAAALHKTLCFDENTWNDICSRLKKFGYSVPPESNRQQALFPEGAEIIHNTLGTAAGCILRHNHQIIFMLPGPPTECLPMVSNIVIPTLAKAGFQQIHYRKKWLLFGVSEGKIAEELDALAKPLNCMTGYRLAYPYIEFKLFSNNKDDFEKLLPIIEQHIQPYLIGDGSKTASQLLQDQLADASIVIHIADNATGGALESTIKTPKTLSHLHFSTDKNIFPSIEISGLNEFWHNDKTAAKTEILLVLADNINKKNVQADIPFRGKRVIHYAVEFVCREIIEFFMPIMKNAPS